MKKRQWIVIAPAAVVIFGLIGYIYGEGYDYYTALLSSLKLVKVYLDPLPKHNILLEIARWIGIIFLFGLVYTALITVVENSMIWKRVRRDDAVAVHGEGVYMEQLLASLGKKGIRSDNRLSFKAPKQVIMFESDDATLDFFQAHSSQLQKADEVHLCLEMGSHISLEQNNVFLINTSEVKAISYWREHFCTGRETIAIIGEGQLAEAVLYWGLLTNIYDREGHFRYLVFGDHEKFQAMHPDLDSILNQYGSDTIEFIHEKWYRSTSLLSEADRIILCKSTWDNVSIANSMCDAGYDAEIHLFTDSTNISALVDNKKCVLTGALHDDNIQEVLLMDDIHKDGKLCHAAYMLGEKEDVSSLNYSQLAAYVTTEEFRKGFNKREGQYIPGDPDSIGGWNSLDAFTRGSNYAAAMHDSLKYLLLKEHGIDVKGMDSIQNETAYERLDQAVKDELQEIEHIRWSRYHFLNNWKCPQGDIVIDGKKKVKDSARRLHTCLRPYSELSAKDNSKDAYFYETLALRIEDNPC